MSTHKTVERKQAIEEAKELLATLEEGLRAKEREYDNARFERLDAKAVKGTVILYNDKLFSKNFPIRKEGMGKLALFVDKSGIKDSGEFNLELQRAYSAGRSAFFKLKFSDDLGNEYRYIDVKGIGMPRRGIERYLETIRRTPGGVLGLLDVESAMEDFRRSNELMKAGVEIAPPIAIIKIDSIIRANGEEISIDELKNEGRIQRYITYDHERCEYTPVVYLRAFKEVSRLKDLISFDLSIYAMKHDMSFEQYADWWLGKIARNLAKIHDAGKAHLNIIDHNVTVDGRIVDFDTVKDYDVNAVRSGRTGMVRRDLRDMMVVLDGFLDDLNLDREKRLAYVGFFAERYLKNRSDIGKEEFRHIYQYFRTQYVNWEGSRKIEEMYEKKFGGKWA